MNPLLLLRARTFWRNAGVALALGTVLAGCRSADTRRPPAGGSAFRFVEPGGAAPTGQIAVADETAQPADVLLPPEPIPPLDPPRYPEGARGKQAIPVTIGVRLTVAKDGTVSDVGWSPLILSTPGPRSEEFRAAVDAAVARWRFTPAEQQRLVPRKSPAGPYWQVVRAEKTDATLDVEFTFTASGEVLSAGVKR